MNNQCAISFGDTVRHPKHPEWGSGAVTKVEQTAINGVPAVRIAVRFKSAGLKTFAGTSLPLEVMKSEFSLSGDGHAKPAIAEVESLEQSGLTEAVEQKIMDIMLAIPLPCRDPFNTIEHRIKRTLDLYKFDLSGRGLMEWAMAQTGMDDPLTRFNRTELEVFFKQFAKDRDVHLCKLVKELSNERKSLKDVVESVPQGARKALTKCKV